MDQIGRSLIVLGTVLVLGGVLLAFGERLPFHRCRLPLDFHCQRENLVVYIPLGTSILLSVPIGLISALVNRRLWAFGYTT